MNSQIPGCAGLHCAASLHNICGAHLKVYKAVTDMQILGAEQFVAVFLTAGMVSSLTSYAGRLRSLKGGHSLGASGAVYACFAAIALLYPGLCTADITVAT